MNVEHGGIGVDGDANGKGECRHDSNEQNNPRAAQRNLGLPPSSLADQAIEERDQQQHRAKPHRSRLGKPFAVHQMGQPLMAETALAPSPRQKILRQRADHQHVEQSRQAEPDQPIARKSRKPFPIEGAGGEITGDEE
ncbi:hypothetical protein ACVIU4_009252 [Bradyrhizobium barranii subsp. barranii]